MMSEGSLMSKQVTMCMRKVYSFYVRCAPGHTHTSFIEIQNILKKMKARSVNVLKERDMRKSSSKNGLFVKTEKFSHGMEIAARCLTIQDVEYVVVNDVCKRRRNVIQHIKQFPFDDFVYVLPSTSSESNVDLSNCFKLQSRANKSFLNSSSFLKTEFQNAITNSGFVVDTEKIEQEHSEVRPHQLRLSLIENEFRVAISLAGGNELFKRTYKLLEGPATAPLPEHQAASLCMWVLNTFFDESNKSASLTKSICFNNILVPFCGTGTLGFESLLVVMGGGTGLFKDRTFSFDSFPCTSKLENKFNSSKIRQDIKREILSKWHDINHDIKFHGPNIRRDTKVLFTDINEDVVGTCRKNIESFLESSDSVFPSSVFAQPKQMDFFDNDVSSILYHRDKIESGSQEECCDKNTYTTGTLFILLNPPFGMRLAKLSSTRFIYAKIAERIVQIRDAIIATRRVDECEKAESMSILGLCLCPDERTWSTFVGILSKNKFVFNTCHFSLGGKDMRGVCFWDGGTESERAQD